MSVKNAFRQVAIDTDSTSSFAHHLAPLCSSIFDSSLGWGEPEVVGIAGRCGLRGATEDDVDNGDRFADGGSGGGGGGGGVGHPGDRFSGGQPSTGVYDSDSGGQWERRIPRGYCSHE